MLKMPFRAQYDLVSDDGYDSRTPMHSDEAFRQGIRFYAKYIGSSNVNRPTSRSEIVTSMRRIRYEFRVKGFAKKKVEVQVSVDGVKVVLYKRNRKTSSDNDLIPLLSHPVHRIFYVSHDSQDLQVFSYIAREKAANVFRCNVFKAFKKTQAVQIVHTIGQAFEICHRLNVTSQCDDEPGNKTESEHSSDESSALTRGCIIGEKLSTLSSPSDVYSLSSPQSPSDGVTKTFDNYLSGILTNTSLVDQFPLATEHTLKLLRHQVALQTRETETAMGQLKLLREQLNVEKAARTTAELRSQKLLAQNQELVNQISELVRQLKQLEIQAANKESSAASESQSDVDIFATKQQRVRSDIKIITPLPLQDATGNRLQLNCMPPKIDPPPRNIRPLPAPRRPFPNSFSDNTITIHSNIDQSRRMSDLAGMAPVIGETLTTPDLAATAESDPSRCWKVLPKYDSQQHRDEAEHCDLIPVCIAAP